MHVDVRESQDVVIVDLEGKLVAGVGDTLLRDVMNELLAGDCRKILLNLSSVSRIDSTGVGELVASLKLSQRLGADLRILKPSNGVHHILKISQILPLFRIYQDEDSALREFDAENDAASN